MPFTRTRRRARGIRAVAGAAAVALAPSADATWSIILIDTRTGEIAVGSATCLTGFDLRANTPILLVGLGAATAQSFVDQTGQNRVFVRDQILLRTPPDQILQMLSQFDNGHQSRQYGITDTLGRSATFSGTGAGGWKGGEAGIFTGQRGDIAYAIQGNVLAGGCVVTEAVAAAIDTPGSLAEKLMASMEAARVTGGDGRCSCSQGQPERCGCPPPSFLKSSHIAYMLIARAGDFDAGNGVYRAGQNPWAIVAGDFNRDGRVDLALTNGNAQQVSVLLNTTPEGRTRYATFALPTVASCGRQPRAIASADLDGDLNPDLVTSNFADATISILRGDGRGGFSPPTHIAVGAEPKGLAIADLDGRHGPDIVVINGLDGTVGVLLSDGSGGFSPPAVYPAGGQPTEVVARDLTGDGRADLAVTLARDNAVALLRGRGDGTFEAPIAIPVGQQPLAIDAADLDGDRDIDLVVANRLSSSVTVLLNTGGVFERADVVLPIEPQEVQVLPGSGDVVAARLGRFVRLRNDGRGVLALDGDYSTGGNLNDLAVADLDRDGDADLAFAHSSHSSALIVENYANLVGDNVFNNGSGTATGDYFMNFNIAFARLEDPDPVKQLEVMYAQWRDGLIGRPDAVESRADFDPARLVADGKSTATLTIIALDWRGMPTDVQGLAAEVEHAPDSAGISSIGEVVDRGGGVFDVTITAGTDIGVDRFLVTLHDGVRPVILMPEPSIRLTVDPDFNGDGAANILDYFSFQRALAEGDRRADLNRDGVLDILDFFTLQEAFGTR